jgi:uncharacterized protein YeaO (DUF488 family)
MSVRVRRIYESPVPGDGYRVLIDRVWPRGIRKEAARLDEWCRELAVSTDLRRWFGHDPTKWAEFQARYRAELQQPERRAALHALADRARHETVILLYGARDEQHNNAVVLAAVLNELAEQLPPSADAGQSRPASARTTHGSA